MKPKWPLKEPNWNNKFPTRWKNPLNVWIVEKWKSKWSNNKSKLFILFRYGEAHIIQQKIIEMEKKEKEMFHKQRQAKIEVALSTLMAKQKTEKEALMMKNNASECELQTDKEKEITRIRLKNDNTLKELKSQQEKELLAMKGQIKSKVAVSACKSRTKIVFSQTQWMILQITTYLFLFIRTISSFDYLLI